MALQYQRYLQDLQDGKNVKNPFLAFIGMQLKELKEGYARFEVPIRPEFIQGAGNMQGGLMAAIADEAIAHAIMTLLSPAENIVTIEMKLNFLASTKSGKLTAEATIFKKGRSLVIGDCLITNTDAKPVVRASATFLICRQQ